ncbi:MAG: Ribosome-recycling factor [Chlamydiae bacterium]|nr:Ribosome-recycling factor [Chlamydiota bacterium]
MITIDQTKSKMQTAIEHLNQELKHIRTGKADPGMLNSIQVEAYGTKMRMIEVATVTCPEPRQILITPFDPQNVGAIRKGIEAGNLNINPIVDGNLIRLNIPPMDQSMRNDMVKLAKKKGEDAKVSIRNARREGNDELKKDKSSGDLSEDLQKKGENDIQQLTDKFCKQVDEIIACKEKEVMAI